MPVVIAVVAILALVGVGAYFWSGDESPAREPEVSIEVTDTNPEEPEAEPEAELESESNEIATAESDTAEDSTADPDTTANESAEATAPQEETYVASATYLTPARTSHAIDVTLTVADGIVVSADVVYDEGEGFSNAHQERFNGVYREEVLGQSLSSIDLSRVGGASLTSEAFNEAVAQIETEASTTS